MKSILPKALGIAGGAALALTGALGEPPTLHDPADARSRKQQPQNPLIPTV